MYPEKMKAAVFHGPRDMRIETLKVPALEPGWVLVKVKAAGICGSDLHLYKEKTSIGIHSVLGEGKYVPGHEFAGTIEATGEDVQGFEKGDRIVVEPIVGCGVCKWCQTGSYNLCKEYKLIGFYYLGGFAEYCAVPAEKCFKVPEHISLQEAATGDCIAVAEHAIRKAGVSNEDDVVIIGAGSIGLFAVQAAKAAGARDVYAVGTHDFQVDAAEQVGATTAINARKEDPVEKILDMTEGKGVDKVIEAVGGKTTVINDAINMLRPQGTLVITGIFVEPIETDLFGLLTKELNVTTAWGYGYWSHRREFEVGMDLLYKGRIDAEKLVTHRYTLEEINDAYAAALDKEKEKSIKVQITFPD
ncbi:MAG: alcohol dehydrogenase catalytic domain-containing protein [Candidatus Thorarchaeota archaeon]